MHANNFSSSVWWALKQEYDLKKKKKGTEHILTHLILTLTFDPHLHLISSSDGTRCPLTCWAACRRVCRLTCSGADYNKLLCGCIWCRMREQTLVGVSACTRMCVTHRSHSSPLRILVGSSSCSPFPEGCTFLRADTGLSRRAPPRLKETDGWGRRED